jgi:hypothetical protein
MGQWWECEFISSLSEGREIRVLRGSLPAPCRLCRPSRETYIQTESTPLNASAPPRNYEDAYYPKYTPIATDVTITAQPAASHPEQVSGLEYAGPCASLMLFPRSLDPLCHSR